MTILSSTKNLTHNDLHSEVKFSFKKILFNTKKLSQTVTFLYNL